MDFQVLYTKLPLYPIQWNNSQVKIFFEHIGFLEQYKNQIEKLHIDGSNIDLLLEKDILKEYFRMECIFQQRKVINWLTKYEEYLFINNLAKHPLKNHKISYSQEQINIESQNFNQNQNQNSQQQVQQQQQEQLQQQQQQQQIINYNPLKPSFSIQSDSVKQNLLKNNNIKQGNNVNPIQQFQQQQQQQNLSDLKNVDMSNIQQVIQQQKSKKEFKSIEEHQKYMNGEDLSPTNQSPNILPISNSKVKDKQNSNINSESNLQQQTQDFNIGKDSTLYDKLKEMKLAPTDAINDEDNNNQKDEIQNEISSDDDDMPDLEDEQKQEKQSQYQQYYYKIYTKGQDPQYVKIAEQDQEKNQFYYKDSQLKATDNQNKSNINGDFIINHEKNQLDIIYKNKKLYNGIFVDIKFLNSSQPDKVQLKKGLHFMIGDYILKIESIIYKQQDQMEFNLYFWQFNKKEKVFTYKRNLNSIKDSFLIGSEQGKNDLLIGQGELKIQPNHLKIFTQNKNVYIQKIEKTLCPLLIQLEGNISFDLKNVVNDIVFQPTQDPKSQLKLISEEQYKKEPKCVKCQQQKEILGVYEECGHVLCSDCMQINIKDKKCAFCQKKTKDGWQVKF